MRGTHRARRSSAAPPSRPGVVGAALIVVAATVALALAAQVWVWIDPAPTPTPALLPAGGLSSAAVAAALAAMLWSVLLPVQVLALLVLVALRPFLPSRPAARR